MNEQPKAVTLAEWIEADIASVPGDTYFNWRDREVVAELRRLVAQRDALLEALNKIAAIENQMFGPDWEEIDEAREIARAAIAAVEGEKT
jgi:hypothetical protein